MAQMYSFQQDIEEVIPWNASYPNPAQASPGWKSVVKFPPKNGSNFTSKALGTPIRIELPAQGYLDPNKTVLEFDIRICKSTADLGSGGTSSYLRNCRFQNNIQSVFSRATEYYGSMVINDEYSYNVRNRVFTEALGTSTNCYADQSAITDGIGGTRVVYDDNAAYTTIVNTRNHGIQSFNPNTTAVVAATTATVSTSGIKQLAASSLYTGYRRYCVKLTTGLFSQGKLIPLQWLASQLAIELNLAPFESCVTADTWYDANQYYEIANVNLIATILNFDDRYEAGFVAGLEQGGIPIKMTSWDFFQYSSLVGSSVQQQLPERHRSLKAIFTVLLPPAQIGAGATTVKGAPIDSHAMLQSSTGYSNGVVTDNSYLINYQFRVGQRYFPSQPVTCGDTSYSNGAAEAYIELAKALNILGDTRLSTAVTPSRWCRFKDPNYAMSYAYDWVGAEYGGGAVQGIGQYGPSFFVFATSFETSDGSEVSGINGEEQNDIFMTAVWNAAQSSSCRLETFVAYDSLLIIEADNRVKLVY
jgi:hypothetical protein